MALTIAISSYRDRWRLDHMCYQNPSANDMAFMNIAYEHRDRNDNAESMTSQLAKTFDFQEIDSGSSPVDVGPY